MAEQNIFPNSREGAIAARLYSDIERLVINNGGAQTARWLEGLPAVRAALKNYATDVDAIGGAIGNTDRQLKDNEWKTRQAERISYHTPDDSRDKVEYYTGMLAEFRQMIKTGTVPPDGAWPVSNFQIYRKHYGNRIFDPEVLNGIIGAYDKALTLPGQDKNRLTYEQSVYRDYLKDPASREKLRPIILADAFAEHRKTYGDDGIFKPENIEAIINDYTKKIIEINDQLSDAADANPKRPILLADRRRLGSEMNVFTLYRDYGNNLSEWKGNLEAAGQGRATLSELATERADLEGARTDQAADRLDTQTRRIAEVKTAIDAIGMPGKPGKPEKSDPLVVISQALVDKHLVTDRKGTVKLSDDRAFMLDIGAANAPFERDVKDQLVAAYSAAIKGGDKDKIKKAQDNYRHFDVMLGNPTIYGLLRNINDSKSFAPEDKDYANPQYAFSHYNEMTAGDKQKLVAAVTGALPNYTADLRRTYNAQQAALSAPADALKVKNASIPTPPAPPISAIYNVEGPKAPAAPMPIETAGFGYNEYVDAIAGLLTEQSKPQGITLDPKKLKQKISSAIDASGTNVLQSAKELLQEVESGKYLKKDEDGKPLFINTPQVLIRDIVERSTNAVSRGANVEQKSATSPQAMPAQQKPAAAEAPQLSALEIKEKRVEALWKVASDTHAAWTRSGRSGRIVQQGDVMDHSNAAVEGYVSLAAEFLQQKAGVNLDPFKESLLRTKIRDSIKEQYKAQTRNETATGALVTSTVPSNVARSNWGSIKNNPDAYIEQFMEEFLPVKKAEPAATKPAPLEPVAEMSIVNPASEPEPKSAPKRVDVSDGEPITVPMAEEEAVAPKKPAPVVEKNPAMQQAEPRQAEPEPPAAVVSLFKKLDEFSEGTLRRGKRSLVMKPDGALSDYELRHGFADADEGGKDITGSGQQRNREILLENLPRDADGGISEKALAEAAANAGIKVDAKKLKAILDSEKHAMPPSGTPLSFRNVSDVEGMPVVAFTGAGSNTQGRGGSKV